MKNIDVIGLFVNERMLELMVEQGEHSYNQKMIDELARVKAIIYKVKELANDKKD